MNARSPSVVMDWPEATWMASLNSTSLHPRVPTAASIDPNTNAVQGCVARLLLVDAMRPLTMSTSFGPTTVSRGAAKPLQFCPAPSLHTDD